MDGQSVDSVSVLHRSDLQLVSKRPHPTVIEG